MASQGPVYYPPPPPRQHSIVGPLLLIVLGGFFLARNFGYSLPALTSFIRYWPALLILVGLVRLAEFLWARQNGRPAPGMGGFAVFILIVVICTGAGLSAAFHSRNDINWGSLRDHLDVDDDLMHIFGTEYTFDGTREQALPAGGTVKITNEHGSISVVRWDSPGVKVSYHKRIFAGSQNEADSADRSTVPRLQLNGNMLVVDANTEGAGARSISSDLEIYAPEGAGVELDARHGDASVSQRGGEVKINAQHGDVTVDQIKGNVTVSSHHGSLHASNVTGNLTADGRLDDLTLDSINGTAFISADIFGDTRLSRLQKGISIRTSRTELQMARLDGDLSMDSGDLQGDGITGPLSLSTKAKDINLRNLSGDLHITDDHGDISYESDSPATLGNMDLTTHHGDVHLKLPPKAAFQYELSTRHGSISSDFENVHGSGGSASAASGTVGRGGVKVTVNCDTGDIELDKSDASVAPAPPPPPVPPARPEKPGKVKKPGEVDVM